MIHCTSTSFMYNYMHVLIHVRVQILSCHVYPWLLHIKTDLYSSLCIIDNVFPAVMAQAAVIGVVVAVTVAYITLALHKIEEGIECVHLLLQQYYYSVCLLCHCDNALCSTLCAHVNIIIQCTHVYIHVRVQCKCVQCLYMYMYNIQYMYVSFYYCASSCGRIGVEHFGS